MLRLEISFERCSYPNRNCNQKARTIKNIPKLALLKHTFSRIKGKIKKNTSRPEQKNKNPISAHQRH
jgi:hypothetical protein